ncbi:hypothetical protein IT411_00160 [Candidatus Peregrinibacteria bacterium]|nr:hypothetical protein [Candidatus Peregrinibacteria bacterium]
MANIGLLSKDVLTKTRVLETLENQGHRVTMITSPSFDTAAFDVVLVDLEDSLAQLVLGNYGYKCMAFGSANDLDKLAAAKKLGCDRVYKHGEFFKKVLPNFKIQ